MKYVLATFVFFLALGLTVRAVASEPAACTAEKTENCKADEKAHEGKHSEKENHGKHLTKKMNSLYPEKQKNPALSARPQKVKLTSPKFLATAAIPSVKLEWAESEGATSYHVQVATDPNFKWLVANENFVKTNSYQVSNLQPGQKYFWRVASVKDENDSSFTKSLFVSSIFTTNK